MAKVYKFYKGDNMPFNQSSAFSGLGTYSVAVPNAGPYAVDGKIALPTIVDGGGPSAVVVAININGGGSLYTGIAGAEGFKADVLCAANDIINVVLSSAAAADQGLNVVKSVINVSQGV